MNTHKLCSFIFAISLIGLAHAESLEQLEPTSLRKHQSINVSIAALLFPPVSHIGEQGRYSGTAVETIRRMCETSNMNCSFQILPTARAYTYIEQGLIDVLMTAKFDRFNECCTFTSWQYKMTMGLYSAQTIETIPSDEVSLLGQEIILIRQWQSPYQVFPNLNSLAEQGKIKISYSNSISSSIKMLYKGRAPLLWGVDIYTWYFKKLHIPMNKIHYKKLVELPSGMWVAKRSTKHDEIIKRFYDAQTDLTETGALENGEFLEPFLMEAVYQDAVVPN